MPIVRCYLCKITKFYLTVFNYDKVMPCKTRSAGEVLHFMKKRKKICEVSATVWSICTKSDTMMQNFCQVHHPLKNLTLEIQDGRWPICLRCPFCIMMLLNFMEIARTVVEILQFSRFSSEMQSSLVDRAKYGITLSKSELKRQL